ncbi:TonB-dependent receptor [Muricauda sp. SCSIO 64092]|uniref:TonB-dependent receptor n=1 Tax=Allomuricauda sp. SCSIO 64092 TaxID=2908842 RepID=UPI001FF14E2C|nr:TonB-dependent receptor [Muricauda sp. SCSIO 64092]UOY08568.1 TonB-dependent receptor [Muricauda sp. SCSIO 64092]
MEKFKGIGFFESNSVKIGLAVKLTLFLLLASILSIHANIYSQRAKVSLNFEDTAMQRVLEEIEALTDFKFVYMNDEINADQRVSLSADNERLSSVLKRLFQQTDISYKLRRKLIILRSLPVPKAAEVIPPPEKNEENQQLQVSGTVTDVNGSPLPGANVLEKGTQNGVVTDFDGKFTISIQNSDAVLVFSYIGFEAKEVNATPGQEMLVQLSTDTAQLEEVVLVGYGVQRKSDVTGSVSSVDGEAILQRPVANAIQGLQGRVAGANVYLNSGSPTAQPRIIIRGLGTINSSSNPLFVVDGVVMEDFQFLNPNDIASMEVLKDASSTAIYGARGANGVILVTTKRGAKTDGLTVSYDAFVSAGTLRKKLDLLNAEEFLEVVETGFANTPKYRDDITIAPILTREDPRLFDAQGNPLYDTDWQEEATRTAFTHNHQLAIQQRSGNSSVGVFLNFADIEGIMLNNDLERWNGKLAYDTKIRDWLSFGANVLVNYTVENSFQEGGGNQNPRRTMIEMPPIFPVRFPDGSWSNSRTITDNFNLEAMANPVHVLETEVRRRLRNQIFGNVYFEFNIMEGLDFKTQFGIDKQDRTFQNFQPNDLLNISAPLGSASVAEEKVTFWQQENFLTYNKSFENSRINAILGASWQQRTFFGFSARSEGFPDNSLSFYRLQSGSIFGEPRSGYNDWSINSYFTRVGYTYKDKYLVTLTGRVDGSSRFGDNNKYGFFPSVGLGWVLSEEDFLSESSFVNRLKLRASYGVTGNTEIAPYSTLSTITSGTALINGQRVNDSFVERLPNPDVGWETTTQFDVGVELSTKTNPQINLELDYYYKLTEDLLLNRPIPRSTGFSTIRDNIGSISNRGADISISSKYSKENFFWESVFNMNYNINRIEELGANDEDIFPGPGFVSGSNTILRVGEPVASFWGLERLGIWGTDQAAEAAAVGALPGEARRSAERTIIGNGLPVWTGSFINNFRLGRFDFTMDLQFVFDVDILQQALHSTEDRSGIANGLRTILTEGWTPQNQNTQVQEIRNQGTSGQNSQVDSRWVADGSYLRGNLFTLGYTLPEEFVNSIGLNMLRVYTSVDNAFVIQSDSFQGFDPEGSSYDPNLTGGQFAQNIFFFQYPRPRTFTLGFNLNF